MAKKPPSRPPNAVELMLIFQHVMDDKQEEPTGKVVDALAKAMLGLGDDDFTQVWLACGTLKGLSVRDVPKTEKLSKHQAAWDRLDRQIGGRVMKVLTTRPPEPPRKKKTQTV